MNDTDPRPQRVLNVDMSRAVLRLIGITLLLEVFSLLLGVAFFAMMHGLVFGILWLAPYWDFARKIVTRTVGPLFPSPYVSIRVQTHLFLSIILFGFCGQNLICLALSH